MSNPKLEIYQPPFREVKIPSIKEQMSEEFNTVTTKKQFIQAPNTQISQAKTANTFWQYDGMIEIPNAVSIAGSMIDFVNYAQKIECQQICNRVAFHYNGYGDVDETALFFSFNPPTPVYDQINTVFKFNGFCLSSGQLFGSNQYLEMEINPHKPIIWITPFSPGGVIGLKRFSYTILFKNLLK